MIARLVSTSPCIAQHQRPETIRIHRDEQDRDLAAIAATVERRPTRTSVVHHRNDVSRLLFEQWYGARRDRIGQPLTAPIEVNNP
jgi:hypothetical protein